MSAHGKGIRTVDLDVHAGDGDSDENMDDHDGTGEITMVMEGPNIPSATGSPLHICSCGIGSDVNALGCFPLR